MTNETPNERRDRREIDEIVRHSTERAEALFPKRLTSWKMRLALFIVGFLIVGNSALNIVNTAILSRATACQKQQSKTLTALRTNNQAATTNWINGVSDRIAKKTLTAAQIEVLRVQYNKQVADNNAQIDRVIAVKCS
jgi:hypothetical protein